ncbi:MAG: glycosyltransferase [Anaerolineales bacterium]|nr:glycosyltransferase [Anaerolineales bacterium]
MPPTVSVVIPTRNRVAYILQALESVFAQTYSDYEIIVVDDGSQDETPETLQPLVKAGKLRYITQPASGVSAARNRGVAEAAGRYIAFLDSDDLFMPSKLEKQVALFERHPQLGFVHCWFSKFDDAGRDLGLRDTSRFDGQIYPFMLQEWDVLMAMPCMLMRKDALQAAGGFDTAMRWGEDLDLWRRMAKRHPVSLVREDLVGVRVHGSNISAQRREAVSHFERYLNKAFADDPGLSTSFRRQTYARLYTSFARNLLGEGQAEDMRLVRQLCGGTLAAWPLAWGAVVPWLASFIPSGARRRLAAWLRRRRYGLEQG